MLERYGKSIHSIQSHVLPTDFMFEKNTALELHGINLHRMHKISFVTRPNLGMIQNDVIESKLFTDYMTAAPFGLNMDPDQITDA
jgi:hypothetical protein